MEIGEVAVSSSLRTRDLSRNRVVGKLPASMSGLERIQHIDLSWNAIQGGLEEVGRLAMNHGSRKVEEDLSVDVRLNYFSGKIPRNLLTLQNISILLGNVFDCRSEVPRHDSEASKYQCGSESIDTNMYIFLSMLGVAAIILAAASGSLVFKSGIFSLAIFNNCSLVIEATGSAIPV